MGPCNGAPTLRISPKAFAMVNETSIAVVRTIPCLPDNRLDQTDQDLLIFTVSDEALEKADGGVALVGH
jgi:hypothetical protein